MAAPQDRAQARMLALATIIAVVSVLYFARDVLIPLAMAILVSFLLSPIVQRLQRLGIPRIAAVLVAVASASALVFVAAWIFLYQMVDLGEQLPQYKENIVKKVDSLQSSFSPWLRRASDAIDDVSSQLNEEKPAAPPGKESTEKPDEAAAKKTAKADHNAGSDKSETASKTAEESPNPASKGAQPVPVRIVSGPTSIPDILNSYVGPVLAPFGTAAVIAVLAIFILIEREDLRNRFIRLISDRQLHQTTDALDDASTRVSRYLLMQLIVNVSYGVCVSLGLWLIDMPNVAVWGLLATVLRFIPYVGPWIAAALPILLSLAIFKGWMQPLLVIGMFVVLELLSNNVMEPMLYGSSTGISAFGIIISAVFWTWLWGGVGLVLATPLTVCLMVLGRHVPQFRYLEILLGDQPPLPFSASVYQRLLALDEDEVANTAKKYLREHSLGELFDDVFLPALLLANQDHQQGKIDDTRWHYIHDALRELIVDLQEEAQTLAAKNTASEAKEKALEAKELEAQESAPHLRLDPAEQLVPPKAAPSDSEKPSSPPPARGKIICLAARDISDELAGQMLAVLLMAEGYTVEVQAARDPSVKESPKEAATRESSTVESVTAQPQLLWISALPPLAEARARELCRQAALRHPRAAVSVGLWQETLQPRNLALLHRAGARDIAATLRDAVAHTNLLLNPAESEPSAAANEAVKTTPISESRPAEKAPALAG